MIRLTAVNYLNSDIIPVLGGIVTAGLLARMIYKLVQMHFEEEPLRGALKACGKYIKALIITVTAATIIYLIDSYYK